MRIEEILAYYKMSDDELIKWKQLQENIIRCCNNMEIPKEYYHYVEDIINTKAYVWSCGYSKDYGYYKIEFGDRGGFSKSINSKDIDKAIREFLKQIVWNVSVRWECSNRNELKKVWTQNVRYDGRKNHFEYAINLLLKVYPLEKIKDYIVEKTNSINYWFSDCHWIYDQNSHIFIENSDSKEKDKI